MLRRALLTACRSQNALLDPVKESVGRHIARPTRCSTSLTRRTLHLTSVQRTYKDIFSSESELNELENDLNDSSAGHDPELDPQMAEVGDVDALDSLREGTSAAMKKSLLREQQENELAQQLVPDPTQEISHLPSQDKWKALMPRQQGFLRSHRWFISNAKTAGLVAQTLTEDMSKDVEPITIVEGYTGPGIMSRAFLQQPSVEKVVGLEMNGIFRKGLENLQQDKEICRDPSRLSIVPESCFQWASYNSVVDGGHLDHLTHVREMRTKLPDYSQGYYNDETWKRPSPLTFFAQMPNLVHSEQLFSQLIRAICHRLWLFRFGRVRMAFVVAEHVANRCFAEMGTRQRGKLTHIVNALTDVKIALPSETFEPSEEHLYPGKINVGPALLHTAAAGPITASRLPVSVADPGKKRLCLLVLEPKVKPLLQGDELDVFDYVTKNLFVLRAQPIGEAINSLGAGANAVIGQLNKGGHPALQDLGENITISPDATPSDLTVEQMVALTRLFDRWPFRPQHLFDEGNVSEVTDRSWF